jgi:hypothetical protein
MTFDDDLFCAWTQAGAALGIKRRIFYDGALGKPVIGRCCSGN